MKDQLPAIIDPNGSYIVNTDTSDKTGTHWQCIVNKDRFKYIYFFDSFGIPPNKTFQAFMKTSGKQILYNSSNLQKADAITCGYYTIYIIRHVESNSMYDVLYNLTQTPSTKNENIIHLEKRIN